MAKALNYLLIFSLLILIAVSFGLGQENFAGASAAASRAPRMMPDEILVKFNPGVRGRTIAAINAANGTAEIATSPYSGVKRLRIPPGRTVEEMVAVYSRNPNVEYSEPNFIAYALGFPPDDTPSPDDPYYGDQWNFHSGAEGGINMDLAWTAMESIGKPGGDPDVIVAVLDGGVAYKDYRETVTVTEGKGHNKTTTTVTTDYFKASDLDSTKFVDDNGYDYGWDFVNNDDYPNDDNGHGTHVTGTIAQSTNNGEGVAGIAYKTSIMPVKVLDRMGGNYFDLADGIYYAADNGAGVINMSLGGIDSSITVEDALAYAYGQGVTMVCASGNGGSSTTLVYPAAYDDYCIAVGATRVNRTVAPYSNGGPSLDITAPGGDMYVDPNDAGYGGVLQQTFSLFEPSTIGYYYKYGTSMAAPHVSGVAALLLAQDPTRTPDEIRDILQSTADDAGAPGRDNFYGYGILNAYRALNYGDDGMSLNPPPDAFIVSPDGTADGYNVDNVINFKGGSKDPDSLTYVWNFGDGTTSGAMDSPDTTHSYSSAGTYVVWLTVFDEERGSGTAGVEIMVKGSADTVLNAEIKPLELDVKRKFVGAVASVAITDDSGQPVGGVTVEGLWSGAVEATTVSGITDANGEVSFKSPTVRDPSDGTIFIFEVSDIPGYLFIHPSPQEISYP